MSYGSPRQQYRVCRDKKLSSFQRRLALTGKTGGGKKIQNATAHVSSTMCSHRKQILCWDSSWPSITIIPARWLWQSWPWFDSLTCCCMGHKLSKSLWHRGSKPRNVSLLKASISGRVGVGGYVPGSIRDGGYINNHQCIRYWVLCHFHAACAYCSCLKHKFACGVSGFNCRN